MINKIGRSGFGGGFNVLVIMKNVVCCIALALLCTSCMMYSGSVDLKKLHNSSGKYGLVVFRSMYFKYSKAGQEFFEDESSQDLTRSNELRVEANQINVEKGFNFTYLIGGGTGVPDLRVEHPLLKRPYKYPDTWTDVGHPAIYKPEYYYTIQMLPQGEYYVSSIEGPMESVTGLAYHSLRTDFKKDQSSYRFFVRPAQINYLGDFFMFAPRLEKSNFFSSSEYTINMMLQNNPERAQTFLKQFHPELDLPFVNSLMHKKQ